LNNLKSAFATFAIIFLKELKHSFRDKDVVIYTVVVPAVLYPLLLVGGIELFIMKQEAATKEVINYAVVNSAEPKIKTVEALMALNKHYKKVETTKGREDLFSGRISLLLDQVNVPHSAEPTGASIGPTSASHGQISSSTSQTIASHGQTSTSTRQTIDSSDDTRVEALVPRSAIDTKVVDDLNKALADNYKTALNQAFKDKGFGPAAVEVDKVEQKNVNVQKKEVFSIGLALLFFSLFNVALGAAYPAIAATSEEFEHNTMETVLMLPVNRWFFLTAKLSAVVSLALLAGSLNLFSMYGDTSLATMGADSVKGVEAFKPDFRLTASQIPWVALAYLAISIIYASVLMMAGACCRSVRSSQQWISLPLTIFIILPFLAIVPQLELASTTAFIPVLGNILALRSLFNGDHVTWLHAVTFIEAMILVAVSMKIAAVLVFERFDGQWRF
jgi:ABC-type Na+ efflux pump permease subunit